MYLSWMHVNLYDKRYGDVADGEEESLELLLLIAWLLQVLLHRSKANKLGFRTVLKLSKAREGHRVGTVADAFG